MGRRPPLQPPVPRAQHRVATARQRGAAEEPRQSRVRAATRPHEAAVGDLARRGSRARRLEGRGLRELPARGAVRPPFQDAPRARGRRRRRRHHRGAVRHRCRPRDTARGGHAVAAAPRADLDAGARRRADRARDPAGRGRALRQGGVPGAAPDRQPRTRERGGHGSARQDRPGRSIDVPERGHRPPPPVRLGARRPERHQGDQEQARRHRQRRRAGGRHRGVARLHAAARGAGGRRHAEGHGARSACAARTSTG